MTQVIRTTSVSITTTGGDGSSAGSGSTSPLTGELLDIYLNCAGTDADTMDITVSETTFGTIMVRTDSHASGRYAPRMAVHDAAAAAITAGFDRYPLKDSILTFTIAQGNDDTDALVATVRWVSYF